MGDASATWVALIFKGVVTHMSTVQEAEVGMDCARWEEREKSHVQVAHICNYSTQGTEVGGVGGSRWGKARGVMAGALLCLQYAKQSQTCFEKYESSVNRVVRSGQFGNAK